MTQKLVVGGNQKTVAAYYKGQPTEKTPDHYVSVEEAKRLKKNGRATSINRGKAILIKGPRKSHLAHRESTKQAWKVIGQTPKRGALRPGFPRYAAV